jgi:hypothetical protein
VPYVPPSGWLEVRGPLERKNVFHEVPDCPSASSVATMRPVDRPGRAAQCPRCVRHTAVASLA